MRIRKVFACLALMFLLAACGSGGAPPGAGSTLPPVQVSITPLTATVALGGTRQFSAGVQGGDGTQDVNWTLSASGNPGSIGPNGLYTAPLAMPASPQVIVRATSTFDSSKWAEATVNLVVGTPPGSMPVAFEVKSFGRWQANIAPATVGIPLPKAVHSNVNTLRVQRMPGQVDVPAQFEVLSRWNDGSIRWVLCDLIADLSAATGIGRYQLNNGGTGSAPATDLVVTDGATSVEVNTQALKFTLSKNAFRLFESIQIDRNQNNQLDNECLDTSSLKGISIVEGADEYVMNNSVPSSFEIEQSGPVRATIRIEGVHRNSLNAPKLDFICRVTAWAGLPYIRVQYSFKNMQGDGVPALTAPDAAAQLAAFETADALNVDLPLDFGATAPAALIGDDSTNQTVPSMGAAAFAELFQTYNGAHDANDPQNPQPPGFDVGSGNGSSEPLINTWPTDNSSWIQYEVSGAVTAAGEHAPGWVQMVGSDLRVTAVVRDFWQMYPKSLRVQGDGLLRVGLWPEAAWQMQVFAGSMRTHEILYSVERSSVLSSAVAVSRFNFLNDPPIGVCEPEHYRASGVFGDIGTTDETLLSTNDFIAAARPLAADYMAQVVAHLGDLFGDRHDGNGGPAAGHEYGFWSYGNGRTFTPHAGWENHDWGISRACFNWFAASGNLSLFRMGDDTARHFRDVTVLHADIGTRFDYTEPGNPAVFGGKASQLGKTRYAPNNKQQHLGHYNFGDHHLDVFKGAFLAEHYLLTGDRLSLDVLKETFTYLRGTWKRHFDAGNGGVNSTVTAPTTWLSNALMIAAAYQMANGLNDPDAAVMADYVWNAVRARQQATTPRDPNGRGFADSNGDFIAWQVGHMVEAMEYSRNALETPNIDQFLLDAMNWLLGTNANVYLGHLATPQFGEFAEMPNGTTDFGGPNLMIGAGYAGAWRESGLADWRTAAQNLLGAQAQNIELGVIGDENCRHSTFAQFFRAGPYLLGSLMQ